MLQKIPIIKNLSPAWRAIAVTVGILILYELGRRIPLLFLFSNIDLSDAESKSAILNRYNFLSLGITPAVTGFFLVEIGSFFLPPLKTWRRNGTRGRSKLTKCALIVSLLLAGQQAYGLALAVEAIRTPDGQPIYAEPLLFHRGMLWLTLFAGFVTTCGLAELITRYGIGNGFVIIIGYALIRYIPMSMEEYEVDSLGRENILTGDPLNLVGFLVFIFIVIVLYQKFGHRIPDQYKRFRPSTLKAHANGKPVRFQLPYLPQGVFSLLWPYSIIASLALSMYARELSSIVIEPSSWTYLIIYTVLLPVTSFLGYFLISHPDRIAHNTLGKIKFQDNWDYIVDRNALRVIIIVTLIWFLWNVPYVIGEGKVFLYYLIDIIDLIFLTAIATDLISEYRFLKQSEESRVLGTFDNVHFVTYLKGLFEAEGIRFCVQAFEYRRLFYFFEPLIKMRVLVDSRDWERAQELADLENVTII